MDTQDKEQVHRFWKELSSEEQESLSFQLKQIDPVLLQRQKDKLLSHDIIVHDPINPFLDYAYAGNQDDFKIGKELIQAGKLGCIVLAGGQGSRLGFHHPKGMFPVSVIKHKSLFQLLAEKVVAASKQAGRLLPIAIMTSPQNDIETRNFFKDHDLFGLDPQQISFFMQDLLPLLDATGHLFLDAPDHIAEGPNGNGSCLAQFYKEGIWTQWHDLGVRHVNLVLVDNPLADPFDAELLGFHVRQQSEITLKCTEKRDAEEKVGVLVKQHGHPRVIEYTELSPTEREAMALDGRLKHRCANLSLFCFSMEFIQYVANKGQDLPLHSAWKAAKFVDESGEIIQPGHPNAWKFEMFIFDVLRYAKRIAALLYQRQECFAPLKNKIGLDSVETVQEALQLRDRTILSEIHVQAPETPFELAADFYYPTPDIISKWQHRQLENGGYISS